MVCLDGFILALFSLGSAIFLIAEEQKKDILNTGEILENSALKCF